MNEGKTYNDEYGYIDSNKFRASSADSSEIIYNPSNVSQGKQVLADASNYLDHIGAIIELGKSSIMESGFKGNVDIDTAQLKTEAKTLETTIDDITHVERAIQEYSSGSKTYIINGKETGANWYQTEYNGTYYSSAALGAAQIANQYDKEKEEFKELTEKLRMEMQRIEKLNVLVNLLKSFRKYKKKFTF